MSQSENRSTEQGSESTSIKLYINLLFINKELEPSTYRVIICVYVVLGLLFMGVGVTLMMVVGDPNQVILEYYMPGKRLCQGNVCEVEVKGKLEAPIYVMYQVGNHYQKFQRYLQSRSQEQLGGATLDFETGNLYCSSPYLTNGELKKQESWNGTLLDENQIASPCGAIAYTFFNDSFTFYHPNKTQVTIDEEAIVQWDDSLKEKYQLEKNSSTTQWIKPNDQHFVVWMRTSGLPNSRKLWGVIEEDLPAGKYQVQISYNYNSSEWDGERLFILTTDLVYGGKNYQMGGACITIAAFSWVACIFFCRKWQTNPYQ